MLGISLPGVDFLSHGDPSVRFSQETKSSNFLVQEGSESIHDLLEFGRLRSVRPQDPEVNVHSDTIVLVGHLPGENVWADGVLFGSMSNEVLSR